MALTPRVADEGTLDALLSSLDFSGLPVNALPRDVPGSSGMLLAEAHKAWMDFHHHLAVCNPFRQLASGWRDDRGCGLGSDVPFTAATH